MRGGHVAPAGTWRTCRAEGTVQRRARPHASSCAACVGQTSTLSCSLPPCAGVLPCIAVSGAQQELGDGAALRGGGRPQVSGSVARPHQSGTPHGQTAWASTAEAIKAWAAQAHVHIRVQPSMCGSKHACTHVSLRSTQAAGAGAGAPQPLPGLSGHVGADAHHR